MDEESSSLKLAERFKVSGSSVRKLRLKLRKTGQFDAGTAPGKPRLVTGRNEKKLLKLVRDYPDATLDVLRELFADATGIAMSGTTIWRQLQRMGLTLKKRSSARPNKTGRT
jgi:transposase